MDEKKIIRCVRLWNGEDQHSHFEEGWIALKQGPGSDLIGEKAPADWVSFRETFSGGSFDWHTAPIRQLVITLSGTLDFETSEGKHFQIFPGDILLAEDTTGRGHRWQLVGHDPWRRVYVVLERDAVVPFVAKK